MKPGLCNATSGGAAEEGYAASRVYWHIADLKRKGALAEGDLDILVAWCSVTALGKEWDHRHERTGCCIIPVVTCLGERHCKLDVGSSGISGKNERGSASG